VFQARRKTGRVDLEIIEMAVRSAMHQAGAAALGELLKFEPPNTEQRILPCACGHQAHYQELRSKPILTAVGFTNRSLPSLRLGMMLFSRLAICVECSRVRAGGPAEEP
jgi:hypothetical protein